MITPEPSCLECGSRVVESRLTRRYACTNPACKHFELWSKLYTEPPPASRERS